MYSRLIGGEGGGFKAHALSLGSAQRFIGKTNFVTS